MKLLIGLGNPGKSYDATRHNVGFDILEILAQRAGSPSRRARCQGELAQATIRGCSAVLVWPLTWMNLSGSCALAVRDFYKIDPGDMLVICDDFNLPAGTIRMRSGGSAGGQNGLADILRRLGTLDVPRLRIGIGPVPPGWKPADFVLGRFSKEERESLGEVHERAADAAEAWLTVGIQAAMNRYN